MAGAMVRMAFRTSDINFMDGPRFRQEGSKAGMFHYNLVEMFLNK